MLFRSDVVDVVSLVCRVSGIHHPSPERRLFRQQLAGKDTNSLGWLSRTHVGEELTTLRSVCRPVDEPTNPSWRSQPDVCVCVCVCVAGDSALQ